MDERSWAAILQFSNYKRFPGGSSMSIRFQRPEMMYHWLRGVALAETSPR